MWRSIFFVSIFLLVSRLFAQELVTFTSPAELYTVRHPAVWHVERGDGIVNITTPDNTGAVTISVYRGDAATVEHAKQLIQRVTKDYMVISELELKTRNEWNGVAGEFTQSDDAGSRVWLVLGACRDRVLVLITANDTKEAMRDRKATYQAVLDSLIIKGPSERE